MGSGTVSVVPHKVSFKANVFHCCEFLLLRKFQEDIPLWIEMKPNIVNMKLCLRFLQDCISEKSEEKITKGDCVNCSAYDMFFSDLSVAITLQRAPRRLLHFLQAEMKQAKEGVTQSPGQSVLTRYLSQMNFVEMHLDGIFKYGEVTYLPKELFRCKNVKVLSLRGNSLESIPPDIGRLSKLKCLMLTNNRLQNRSIPYTLTFCQKLTDLYLDNNLLDALPGFLLEMRQLNTVHRHGNHNYFKATFMWYHTDVNDRVLRVCGYKNKKQDGCWNPKSLMFLAAEVLIASKINFFEPGLLPTTIQDYIVELYPNFNVCANCCTAIPLSVGGFKVFTFKNPYLGNTCVPFQHWACCRQCAESIEVPARLEQMNAALKMEAEYAQYVEEFQRRYCHVPVKSRKKTKAKLVTFTIPRRGRFGNLWYKLQNNDAIN